MANVPCRVVAVGVGRMGRGIAHMFAYAGYPVTLLDMKERDSGTFEALVGEARAEIESTMNFLVSQDVMTSVQVVRALQLIEVRSASEAPSVLADADVVLEGVRETIEAKTAVFAQISELVRTDTIIASTTSSMLVDELQAMVTAPNRFLNAHFLNPAYLIPLVEVSANEVTDEQVVETTIDLLKAIGKVPVRCSSVPGAIIPRLQSLLMAECCRMVDEGVASAAEIDKAIMNGFGPRYSTMGVIEFIDWGGVDIFYYAGHHLAKALGSERHEPPPEVEQMMKDGRRGMREGQGYYDFRDIDIEAFQREKLTRFVTLLRGLDKIPAPGV